MGWLGMCVLLAVGWVVHFNHGSAQPSHCRIVWPRADTKQGLWGLLRATRTYNLDRQEVCIAIAFRCPVKASHAVAHHQPLAVARRIPSSFRM